MMGLSTFSFFVFLAAFAITAVATEDAPSFDSKSIEAGAYGSSSFDSADSADSADKSDKSESSDSSSDSRSSDTTPEEPLPPPSSALANLGPLLSLLQPIIGGLLNGASSEMENGVTYPPLLKPLFDPLPILPGFGVLPASIAAQASDFIASAAASARGLFANAARENAARSQVNYGHFLNALNELNMPAADEPNN